MSLLPSSTAANYFLDNAVSSTGTIGYLALLSNALLVTTVTADTNDSSLTTTLPHRLVTGSRVRIQSSGTLPAPLLANVTYYAKVLTPTKFQLCSSLPATANSPIQLTSLGSGTLTINEQSLSNIDPLEVLVNKELSLSATYTRPAISNVGTASYQVDRAVKPPKEILIRNELSTSISYGYQLILLGGTPTPNSFTSVVEWLLEAEATPVVMAASEIRSFTAKFALKISIV
jgi:hypothetical protein